MKTNLSFTSSLACLAAFCLPVQTWAQTEVAPPQSVTQDAVAEAQPVEATANSETSDSGPTEEQIARLAKYLTGARLTGHFTVTGAGGMEPREESYWIDEAKKNPEGDKWTITARIKYGKNDVKVPMVMDIKWAGDTPVITVDQMTIPLMGTFDARVLFRGGQYAGTWRHDDVGGHLFGTVTTAEEQAKENEEPQKDDQPASVSAPKLPCKDDAQGQGEE